MPDQENLSLFFNMEAVSLLLPMLGYVVFFDFFKFGSLDKGFEGREGEVKMLFFLVYFCNLSGLGGGWEVLASMPFALLCLSFAVWSSLMLSWVGSDWRSLFSGLSPSSDFKSMSGFLSLIELISLVSRPVILSIRLTVNITVGMLFFNLLEEAEASRGMFHFLSWFEGFVAFMQALIYVFLISNYSAEKVSGL